MNEELFSALKETFTIADSKKSLMKKEGEFFWKRDINKWEKCGEETINFINGLSPSLVLDLGCGDNQYKRFVPSIVGIDLINELADIKADISAIPYANESADAVICFGSINFGDTELIRTQLTEMLRVLKPGGYAIFRGNMNDHDDERHIYYGWNKDLVYHWTTELNLTLHVEPTVVVRTTADGKPNLHWVDKTNQNINVKPRTPYRLYWIWKK